jgi:hypothetical protein
MSLKIPPTPEKQNHPLLYIVKTSPFCHPNDLTPIGGIINNSGIARMKNA